MSNTGYNLVDSFPQLLGKQGVRVQTKNGVMIAEPEDANDTSAKPNIRASQSLNNNDSSREAQFKDQRIHVATKAPSVNINKTWWCPAVQNADKSDAWFLDTYVPGRGVNGERKTCGVKSIDDAAWSGQNNGYSMVNTGDYVLAAMSDDNSLMLPPQNEIGNIVNGQWVPCTESCAVAVLRAGWLPWVVNHETSSWNPDNDPIGYAIRAVMMTDGYSYSLLAVNRSSKSAEMSVNIPAYASGRMQDKFGIIRLAVAPSAAADNKTGQRIGIIATADRIRFSANGTGQRINIPPLAVMSIRWR